MTKFLIGMVTGFILTGLVAVILVVSLVRFGSEKKPVVAANSALMLRLEGDVPERAPVEFPIPFFEQQTPVTVREVSELLRKAAADSRIKAVALEPKGVHAGWAKLEEMRVALATFRKSGKPLVAYLKSPGMREYYLASAADRIHMGPEDYLDVKGLRAEMMYFRGTLDKLGVQVEVEHAGKYKDFGDMFERKSMSPETKQVMDSILDDLYGRLVSTLAAARKKTPEEIRAAIDEGPFLPKQAVEKGLVDNLGYEDQMIGELEGRLKSGELKKLSHREYLKVSLASLGLEGKPKIALLVAQGDITRGDPSDDGASDEGITATGFSKLLRRVAGDSAIRAVVVRIDSGGGDAVASDEIWREMNLLSKKKPVVISMSDAAASGGYYMAMTGDPVVAYPGTFTGSIGVVFGKPNLRGLYEKLGISKDFLTRGRYANIDSDYEPLSAEAWQKLREGIDRTYQTFVQKVADARKRPFQEMEALAQGRVWLGSQAKERGLVDELGGLDRAVELAKERAKIGKDEKVTIVPYPPRRSVFDIMLGSKGIDAMFESRITPQPLAAIWKSSRARLWMQGGLMHVMPFQIEVK